MFVNFSFIDSFVIPYLVLLKRDRFDFLIFGIVCSEIKRSESLSSAIRTNASSWTLRIEE